MPEKTFISPIFTMFEKITKKIKANEQLKSTLFFIILSAGVMLELYFAPLAITPELYVPISYPHTHLEVHLIIFSIMAFLFLRVGPGFKLREKVNFKFFILHFIAALAFFYYLDHLLGIYPFEPLSPDSIIVKIASLINRKAMYLVIRYRLIYISLYAICHLFLFLSFFERKRAAEKYTFSTLSTIALSEFPAAFLWRALCFNIAGMVLFLLKICGFETTTGVTDVGNPIVGILGEKPFIESIGYTCAGLEGIMLFVALFGMLLILDRKKIIKSRAVIVGIIGILIMFFINILRIFSLFLIAYFYDPEFAISTYHSYIGMILYFIIIVVYVSATYRWILKR